MTSQDEKKDSLNQAASELSRKSVLQQDNSEYGFDPNRLTDAVYAVELNDQEADAGAALPEDSKDQDDSSEESSEDDEPEDSDEYEDEEDLDDEDEDLEVSGSVQAEPVKELSEEDQQKVKALQAQIQALLQKNRLSNYLLLLLIVAYVFWLFFANSWYLLLIIIIPMVGLLIWDHRILKQIRSIQSELRAMGTLSQAPSADQIKSLNELPKQYTVLDDVIVEDYPVEHVILSPYGIFYVAKENIDEKVAADLGILPQEVHFLSEEMPVHEQVEAILKEQNMTIPEVELMKMAYKLMGIEK